MLSYRDFTFETQSITKSQTQRADFDHKVSRERRVNNQATRLDKYFKIFTVQKYRQFHFSTLTYGDEESQA